MPQPAILKAAECEALDVLGPVLCLLLGQQVTLSAMRHPISGFSYHLDWHDGEGGFFSGVGDTPTEALAAARLAGAHRLRTAPRAVAA